jgi:hypothetical protein
MLADRSGIQENRPHEEQRRTYGKALIMPSFSYPTLTLLLATVTMAGTACQKSQPTPSGPQRIENSELGIAIANLPEPFEVESNQASDLRLRVPGPNGVGTIAIGVGPVTSTAINLPAEAKATQEHFETLPAGRYFGNLELVTPIGSAFTARGAYDREGVTVEEIRVFALHPTENRLLLLTFVYPEGEGKERMQQLAGLLGEIESLPSAESSQASEVSGN